VAKESTVCIQGQGWLLVRADMRSILKRWVINSEKEERRLNIKGINVEKESKG